MARQLGTLNGVSILEEDSAPGVPVVPSGGGGKIAAVASAILAVCRPTRIVDTIASLFSLAAKYRTDGQTYKTLRYSSSHEVGDGSGNTYIYHATGRSEITANGGFLIAGTDEEADDYLEARDKSVANGKKFGLLADGSTDNAAVFANLLTVPVKVDIPSGDYATSETIAITSKGAVWHGAGDSEQGSIIRGLSVTGDIVKIGDQNDSDSDSITFCNFQILGTCTAAGLHIENSSQCRVRNVNASCTCQDAFFFDWTWASTLDSLSSNTSNVSRSHFAVGGAFNANICSNWYTTGAFSGSNFLIDSSISWNPQVSHGNQFSMLTAQGGRYGLNWVSGRSASIAGFYSENTVTAIRIGSSTSTPRGLHFIAPDLSGPYEAHPDYDDRTALIELEAGYGLTFDSPSFEGSHLTLSTDVTITGDGVIGGSTGAYLRAIVNPDGTVAHIVVIKPGSGFTTATLSIGGAGTGATATANLNNGGIESVTVTDPGSGYDPTLPPVRYTDVVKTVINNPAAQLWTGANNPMWPGLVRSPDAETRSCVRINNDVNFGRTNSADLIRGDEFGAGMLLVTHDSSGAEVVREVDIPTFPSD